MTKEKNNALLSKLTEHQRDKFLLWLLTDKKHGLLEFANTKIRPCIEGISALFKRKIDGEHVSREEWQKAANAAAYQINSAPPSVGYDAAYQADSAHTAALAAVADADIAATWVGYAVHERAYVGQHEKILELLRDTSSIV
jgi:hypothetical protein